MCASLSASSGSRSGSAVRNLLARQSLRASRQRMRSVQVDFHESIDGGRLLLSGSFEVSSPAPTCTSVTYPLVLVSRATPPYTVWGQVGLRYARSANNATVAAGGR